MIEIDEVAVRPRLYDVEERLVFVSQVLVSWVELMLIRYDHEHDHDVMVMTTLLTTVLVILLMPMMMVEVEYQANWHAASALRLVGQHRHHHLLGLFDETKERRWTKMMEEVAANGKQVELMQVTMMMASCPQLASHVTMTTMMMLMTTEI